MGQQQLLLIVLGVIIVGIAIVVGINLFNANAISSNRDAIISDLNNLAALAQQYYQKPVSMGGGGGAFDKTNGGPGWSIPTTLVTTANGTYDAAASATDVVITGTSTTQLSGNTAGSPVKAVVTVTATAIRDSVAN